MLTVIKTSSSNTMNKGKVIKLIAFIAFIGGVAGSAIVYYMFNMPHRDVSAARIDMTVEASTLVNEFLTDAKTANQKYLDESGDSKILLVSGKVVSISEDYNGDAVALINSGSNSPAGVSATFVPASRDEVMNLAVGQQISIKGVIRSGASYDEDLEMYENVIIEKSSLIK